MTLTSFGNIRTTMMRACDESEHLPLIRRCHDDVFWANQHEINVKLLTEGRLADSEWCVEDKDYSNAAAR